MVFMDKQTYVSRLEAIPCVTRKQFESPRMYRDLIVTEINRLLSSKPETEEMTIDEMTNVERAIKAQFLNAGPAVEYSRKGQTANPLRVLRDNYLKRALPEMILSESATGSES